MAIISARDAFLEEVGGIVVYGLQDIIGRVLPSVSEIELLAVKEELNLNTNKFNITKYKLDTKMDELTLKTCLSRAWLGKMLSCKGQPSKGKGKKKLGEARIFSGISKIFNSVANAVEKLGFGKPMISLVDLLNRAHPALEDEIIVQKTKPDATFILRVRSVEDGCLSDIDTETYRLNLGRYSWADCAGTNEYQVRRGGFSIKDNVRKVIHRMNQVMGLDPCRTSCFAFSFEDDHLRFFWCDRSGLLCSEYINYFQNLDSLLIFYISLAKATREQLGFDPTVSRVKGQGGTYRFSIEGRDIDEKPVSEVWETVRWLSNDKADFIIGSATRVWEVRRIHPPPLHPNDTSVLKDAWIEPTRHSTEGFKYREIFRWLADHPEQAEWAKHFFTLHADEYLQIRAGEREGEEVSTFGTIRGGLMPAAGSVLEARTFKVDPLTTLSFNTASASSYGVYPAVSVFKRRAFSKPAINRKHYRLILREVGQRVDSLTDFESVFQCLIGASRALQVLQMMGTVHMDVSCGNVMLVDSIGKLGDLEFCIEYDRIEPTVHTALTGTPFFMSAEVLVHEYLWWSVGKGSSRFGKRKRYEENSPAPFRHNFIHDSESLWWIYMFILLSTRPVEEDEEITAKHGEDRAQIFTRFFPNENRILLRSNSGINPFHNVKVLLDLRSQALPKEYAEFLGLGGEIRDVLADCHVACQPSWTSFDPSPMKDIHLVVDRLFSTMLEVARQSGQFRYTWASI